MCKIIQVYYPACGHTLVHRTIKCSDPTKGPLTTTSTSNDASIAGLEWLSMRQQCRSQKPAQVETETHASTSKKCPNCEKEDLRLKSNKTRRVNRHRKHAKEDKRKRVMSGDREGSPGPE